MNKHERFQSFCKHCYKVAEADTVAESVRRTEEHEKQCPRKRIIYPKEEKTNV